jgi:multidrug resistance efflux pump
MRKAALILLVLSLFITPALAEGDLSLSGQLEPARTDVITAPFSGTVVSAPLSAGDFAAATDALFELTTTKVYAPCDGTVAGLRAQEGDSLSDLALMYQAPLYIEPDSAYVISASTSGAYDDNDNRYIHVGEHVYLTSTNNSSRTGEGIITSVTGTAYTVEVQSGTIRLAETCRISRDPDSDEAEGRIGSGKTERNNPVPVTADGSVLRVCVSEGDSVRKGDLIMETVPGDLRNKALTGSHVTAGADVVVQSVSASVGDVVQQGQALAVVFPVGTLVALVQVDESDLVNLEIGDDVTIELDGTSGAVTYPGVVETISRTANPEAVGAAYDVTISFENDDFVRQGMSVTVRKAL